MNVHTLSTLMKARGLSQSDLARRAGVTRQAASLWFKSDDPRQVNVQSRHLEKLSRALSVSMDELARPLPVLGDESAQGSLETALLWDRLFPSLDDFAIAVARGEERSLARLAQVYGLYAAGRMAGRRVWKDFPRYKCHIHPVRRRELERLWDHESSLTRPQKRIDPAPQTKAGPGQSTGFTTAFQIASRMAGRGALAGSFKPGSRRLTAVGGKGNTRQV